MAKRLILPGMHPDPTICRVGSTFYLATSTFGLFPGVPLYASEDLHTWRFVRHLLDRPQQLPFRHAQNIISGGIYAPTLRHDGQRFYLITTNVDNGGHFIVTATDPAEPWSDPIWIDSSHQGGIDPSLTFLEDGTTLCQTTWDPQLGESYGLIQFELDPLTGRGLTRREHLSSGFGGKATEAPHVFSRGDFWYLVLAEGGTESCHRVMIGRSDSPLGPWVACPHNPILCHAGTDHPIQNTGHADFVEDATGHWWMVFLGVRPIGYHPMHITGRESFITPVTWSDDGWPVIEESKELQLTPPTSTDTAAKTPPPWMDCFDGKKLSHNWVTLGSSYQNAYSLSESPGLILHALSDSLSRNQPQGFVGTRLAWHSGHFDALLQPSTSGVESGIVAYMDASGYYALGVRCLPDGQVRARLTRHILGQEDVCETSLGKAECYELRLDSTELEYPGCRQQHGFIFSVRPEGGQWQEVGHGVSRLLSTEVIGGFTGMLIGLYCISEDNDATSRILRFSAIPGRP